MCRTRGEVDEAEVCAGCSFGVVDRFIVVEDADDVDGEWEGEGGDDGVDDWFESGGCRCLIGICGCGHCNFEDDVEAFVGLGGCVDATVCHAAGLYGQIVVLEDARFFKERGDDSAR